MANQPSKYSKFLIGAASAALVASAVAPVASAADFSDVKGNTHEEAINALVKAGVISGYPDGSFLPNKTLTRSDVVKMMGKLLVSLGKEVPTDYKTNPRFTDQTSKTNEELLKYSALVKDHGVFNGKENGSLDAAGDITRENMAIVLVRAYDAINKTDLVAYVAEQEFKKDVTDLATAKAEAQPFIDVLDFFDITNPVAPQFNPKATTTRGQFATFLFKTTAVEAPGEKVTTATKVESVTATNLKEVEVKFDGTVDEDTATEKANYSLKSGKAIKSVALAADGKSVTITVVGTLANNKVDALTVSNVKAGDKVIDVKNFEFTAVDNKLPEVLEIKSLGTKSVKVTFSEPVTELKQSNFTLDGKAYFGKVDVGANDRSVILTPFSSSALEVGDHKLTVSGVKDAAGFISLASTHDFTVVEDKVEPTVTEATATLESVTLTFSEDVDASTVLASKVYWKSGDSKKTATGEVEVLADNKFKFYFSSANSLPTGAVDIYVEGVKDYSANEIAKDTKVSVTPVIDQTRPEVRKVTVQDEKTIKVTFSKAINEDSAKLVNNYTVLNKDGKVISVQDARVDTTDAKSVIIKLYTDLSTGENKLTIKNLKDATKLQNTMLDYSEKIVRADKDAPKFDSTVVSHDSKRVVLKFNKKMNVDTLVDYSNYLVKIDNKLQTLTSNIADISVLQDGTAVAITFAETIDGKTVSFTSSGTGKAHVTALQVLGVKDLAGNLLKEFANPELLETNEINLTSNTTLNVVAINSKTSKLAELVDTQTVKVKFNAGINEVSAGAFAAVDSDGNSIIDSVDFDGTSIVTLKLKKDKVKTDGTGLNLTVTPSNLTSVAGKITAGSPVVINTANVLDSVAPEITNTTAYDIAGEVIKITYSEALEFGTANQELKNSDFTVVRISDNKTLDVDGGYSVAIAGGSKEIHITLKDTATRTSDTAYRVTVKGAKYTTDSAANEITDSVGVSDKITFTAASALTVLNTALDTPTTATVAQYSAAGVTGVNAGNLTAVNSAVEAAKVTKGSALTKAEIQTKVDAVVAAIAASAAVLADLNTAKTAVEGATYTLLTADTNVQAATKVKAVVDALPAVSSKSFTSAVTEVSYSAATAGTTDGEYKFTVKLTAADTQNVTTSTVTVVIPK